MQLLFDERTYLVTGGGSGIGKAVAAGLVAAGAAVMIVGRNADELGASWVRVNGIRPGLIRTDLVAPITDSPDLSEDYRICTPLPRVGEVEDIANLAMFLLSDAAGWITGQIINADGGQMLRRSPDFTAMLQPVFGADGLRGVL